MSRNVKIISGCLVIIVIIIAVVLVMNNKKDGKSENILNNGNVSGNTTGEEFVNILPDGTKLNNSEKLRRNKSGRRTGNN